MTKRFSLTCVLTAGVLLLLCCALTWAGTAKEELRPIPAAEAEKRTNDTRDFVMDLMAGQIDKLWHGGKWEDCIRLTRQTIELDPHDTEAWTDLGWVLANMNRDAEAIEAYRAGIRANPGNFDIYQQFGLLYDRRHKYNEAVEQFRKAAANGAPRAWQHMVPRTLEKAGRKQEALDEWRALLKRFPNEQAAQKEIKRLEGELNKARPV
jgi:Flp pilus assembly protein TadD